MKFVFRIFIDHWVFFQMPVGPLRTKPLPRPITGPITNSLRNLNDKTHKNLFPRESIWKHQLQNVHYFSDLITERW